MHDQSFLKRMNNPQGLVKSMDEHIAHFKQRLQERFNIDLTTEEYYDLVHNIANAKYIYPLNSANGVYAMTIRGQVVWVIYGRNQDKIPSRLKTAMIPYKGLVVPNRLAHKYNNISFTTRVGEIMNEVVEISKTIDLNDTKSFFVGYEHIPLIIKSLALNYKKYQDAWDIRFLGGIIRYIDQTEGAPFDFSTIASEGTNA